MKSVKTPSLKIIRTRADHEAAMAEILQLIENDPPARSPARDRLEVLAVLIEQYERQSVDLGSTTPKETIEFLMDQHGLTRSDLVAYFGSARRVAGFLAGRTAMSVDTIRQREARVAVGRRRRSPASKDRPSTTRR